MVVLLVLSLTIMFARLAGNLIRYYGGQVPSAMPVTTLTQNLAQLAVVILGSLVLLNHFEVSITPILTALGVGGLAVALALAGYAVEPVLAGFYVAVAGQVRLGDYVKLNYRRGGLRHRHRLAVHHAPGAGQQPDHRAQRQAGAGDRDQLLPAGETDVGEVAGDGGYDCDPDEVEAILLAEVVQAGGGRRFRECSRIRRRR